MKNIFFTAILFFNLIPFVGFGQGTETFSSVPTSSGSSYITRNWTGDDGSTWEATNSRTTDATFVASGQGIGLNDDTASTYVESGAISGGIGNITITVKQIFSGSGSGSVTVYINGSTVGTVPYDDSETGITSSITGINQAGDFTIRVSNDLGGSSGGGNDRVAVDNITWTAYTSSQPTVSFDSSSSSETESDSDVITSGIPVTMTNYDAANVTITPTVNGASTAEAGDYTIDLTPLVFDANETLNIPLTIKDDADFNDETLIVDFTVTSGTAELGTSQHTVTINDDEVPLLIITEVADPIDASGRFVEIFNTGDISLDLSSLQVYFVKSVNSGPSYSQKALSGTIEPNQVMVIANSTDMNADYGFSPDISYSAADGNGDDAYALYFGGDRSSGSLLDTYGVQGVDGSGEAWEYEDSRAIRNNPLTAVPNATWTSGEWTISSADLADTTPGSLENEFRYDGDWKPRDVYANSSTSDDVYISSSVSLSGDLSVNDFEIKSDATLTIEPAASLNMSSLENNGSIVMQSSSTSSAALITSSRTGSGTYSYQKYVSPYSTTNDLISAPFTGLSFTNTINNNPGVIYTNPSDATQFLFGPFDNDSGSYINYDSDTDGNQVMSNAKGYRVGTQSGQTITFTGSMSVGNTGIIADQGSHSTYGKWNLIGNPFPSYVDLNHFFDDHDHKLATGIVAIYAYDGDDTDGSVWTIFNSSSLTDGNGDPIQKYIAPGQAFFVAVDSQQTFIFEHDMKSVDGGDDFIASRMSQFTDTHAVITLQSNGDLSKTDLYFRPSATVGYDPSYDAGKFANESSTFDIYTKISDPLVEDINFAIQTISNDLSETVVIPLGVHISSGENHSISIDDVSLLESINVYLKDYETGTLTLLNNGAYSFSTDSNLEGISRFELRLTNTSLGLESDELMTNFKAVYQNDAVVLMGDFMIEDKVEIYDIMGRLTQSHTISGNHSIEITKNKLATGVYLAKINRNGNSKTIKFIIN